MPAIDRPPYFQLGLDGLEASSDPAIHKLDGSAFGDLPPKVVLEPTIVVRVPHLGLSSEIRFH